MPSQKYVISNNFLNWVTPRFPSFPAALKKSITFVTLELKECLKSHFYRKTDLCAFVDWSAICRPFVQTHWQFVRVQYFCLCSVKCNHLKPFYILGIKWYTFAYLWHKFISVDKGHQSKRLKLFSQYFHLFFEYTVYLGVFWCTHCWDPKFEAVNVFDTAGRSIRLQERYKKNSGQR